MSSIIVDPISITQHPAETGNLVQDSSDTPFALLDSLESLWL